MSFHSIPWWYIVILSSHLRLFLQVVSLSLSFRFSHQNLLCNSSLSRKCHMPVLLNTARQTNLKVFGFVTAIFETTDVFTFQVSRSGFSARGHWYLGINQFHSFIEVSLPFVSYIVLATINLTWFEHVELWLAAGVGGDTCDRLTFLVRRHSAGITSKNKRLSSRVTVLTSCLAVAFSADISSETTASAAKTSSVFLSHRRHEHTNTGKKQ